MHGSLACKVASPPRTPVTWAFQWALGSPSVDRREGHEQGQGLDAWGGPSVLQVKATFSPSVLWYNNGPLPVPTGQRW